MLVGCIGRRGAELCFGANQEACPRTWRTWFSVKSWYLDATNRRSRVFASSSACVVALRLDQRLHAHWLFGLTQLGSFESEPC